MEDKMKETVAEALEVDKSQITDESSMGNIENWDSLSHIRIITNLEEKFDVKFDENDIMRMTSIAEIKKVLKEKGVE